VRDRALLKRLAKDRILVECCMTSNYQTGAVKRGQRHPIHTFLEHGIPVAVCTDNTTVSATDQTRENALLGDTLSTGEIARIHAGAAGYSFIRRVPDFVARRSGSVRSPGAPGAVSGRR
jgi:adenosine deaminase